MSKYKIMDLFAGVGGLSYGFSKLPEFEIVAANEIEKDIATAYKLNHPGVTMMNCDINELTEETLAEALNGEQIDIIVGGPPCQSYSTLGKRQLDDRANLFLQYKRVLKILKPRAFVFENVVGILSMDKGKLFKQIQAEFGTNIFRQIIFALAILKRFHNPYQVITILRCAMLGQFFGRCSYKM